MWLIRIFEGNYSTEMNHKTKTLIFKILDILPDSFGFYIYHKLQQFSENSNLKIKIDSSESTFNSFQKICSTLNIQIKGSSILEIGSGWLPIMPYFFVYKGLAKSIYTYDLNTHYQKKFIRDFNIVFTAQYNIEIKTSNKKYNLPDNVHYFPSQNIINSQLADVQIVFSRFVLEHVTPDDIYDMHKKFKTDLAKGSIVIHFISPSDHRAYSDSSLSLQDFLQYSEKEWNTIQTKFDYHNRLRLPQYIDIFKSLDYEILFQSSESINKESSQYNLFKKLNIHADFMNYTEEELTAGSIILVLKT